MATQCKSDVPNEVEEVKGWIKRVELGEAHVLREREGSAVDGGDNFEN